MGIEQRINYHLNKVPGLKKVIKSVYQHAMYALSSKRKSKGDIVRISPADDREYFFGYYDKSPWDASDRYMLCLRANDTWTDVSPREKADILIIDTWLSEYDNDRVKKIAETSSWNVQQSCMLQWLGPDYSSRILFNDYRDGHYVSVIKEVATGKEHVLQKPVYTVASDGRTALTLDFSRLYNLRPGYGYYNVPEETKDINLPDAPAVWKMDLESGEIVDILSYRDFADFQPRPEMMEKEAVHKVNHLMISPDGKRFMVLYRWFVGTRKYTRLITCNVDGTEMYLLSDDDMVSHCYWKDDKHILAFENKKGIGTGYFLMTDGTQEFVHCWPELVSDGHPSYSPDRSKIITDSYPDRARMQYLRLMRSEENSPEIIAEVFSPFRYDNDTRCDLHPRWNHSGTAVCIDSVFEGHRGLYTVSIQKDDSLNCDKKVTVIIPVYNVAKYVRRCVESVVRQTYPNIEIILVNDGSTDDSLQVCQQLQEQYPEIIIIDKQNGGLSSARNAGLRIAKGDYIAFLDSDDWVTPDCYAYMLKLVLNHQADLSDIMIYQVNSENDEIPKPDEMIEIYTDNGILEHYMYRGMKEQKGAPYSVCRKLYKRELFRDDTAAFVEGTVNEDICFNYRILQKCSRVVVSNQIKYLYYQGEESITNGALKAKDLALLTVSHDLLALAEESGDKRIIELAKMKEARSYFSLLARVARDGIDTQSIAEPDDLITMLRKRLKKNLGLLLRSPMSLTRKALTIAFAINFRLSRMIIELLHL